MIMFLWKEYGFTPEAQFHDMTWSARNEMIAEIQDEIRRVEKLRKKRSGS